MTTKPRLRPSEIEAIKRAAEANHPLTSVMKRHTHRAIIAKDKIRGWTQCVTSDECAAEPKRQAAHGAIIIDVCSCGAIRLTESNLSCSNRGPWLNQFDDDGGPQ